MNGFDLTACLELNLLFVLSRIFSAVASGPPVLLDHPRTLNTGCKGGICLVGEKPDKVLPGIVGGAWRYCPGHRILYCMMCVVNFVFALSHLQGVEWGWPGRREPDDEPSRAS